MITSVIFPDEYSFIGNPMLVKIQGNSPEEVILSIEINNVLISESSIFLFGNGTDYKGSFNMAKFLPSFFKDHIYSGIGIIQRVTGFALNYKLTVKNYQNHVFTGVAFYGGISYNNYSTLNSMGRNMFSYRLQNYERQFFFTTRTNSSRIVLRESEVQSLIFIHPGKPITAITPYGNVFLLESFTKDSICALDLSALRKVAYRLYNELPSFFAISVDGITCAEITIVPSAISDECYLLTFRNSIGAYEQIEVTGKSYDQTTFSDEDSWLSLTQYNTFEEKRSRVLSRKKMIATAGYKTKEELNFITDLIKSEDIYFVDLADPAQREYRCLITPDETKYPRLMRQPESITFNIRFVADDAFVSPELNFETQRNNLFQNITAQGKPMIEGEGLIYADDYPFYAE